MLRNRKGGFVIGRWLAREGVTGSRESVEIRGEVGPAEVVECQADLWRGDAAERELGERVFGEEAEVLGLEARPRFAAEELAEEEQLVDVEREARRVPV